MASVASISFGNENRGFQIGDNHGSIHAEIHPHERPETPPSPLSTVPFPRDPDFVRRDTLLDQISTKCLPPRSRIALVGLGGVGKSQLAIEYSYQVRSVSPATWVFWVHASNEARFEQSFRDIADQLKLPGLRDPRANVFQLVENWLRDEKKGRWICVLDNVDDGFLRSIPAARKDDRMEGSTNAPTKPLLDYIPRNPNGSTVITSRSREIALSMVNHKDLVEVKPMERSEALDLLQKKLDQPGGSQESQSLVEALEFMPLAIIQAASFIRNRAPRYSVRQYLNDFQKSDREAITLLRKEVGHTYRDWEAKNSILVTWQLSFDYIRQTKPSAADLLSLMSFFDRQGIPESLVRHQPKANIIPSAGLWNDSYTSDGETSESDIGPDFEEDVTLLRDYSFISINEDSTLFTMHRLVQLSTRAWLKSHGKVDQWREVFIDNLSEDFPTGKYENWTQCRLFYPHMKCAMAERPEEPNSQLRLATLMYKGAWYASESGMIGDMSELALKSRKYRLDQLGADNRVTLDSTAMLGSAYRKQGLWDEAEQLEVQVMETRKTKLGEDHPDTLTSMANLALTYSNQGRWDEAEQLQVQLMETRKTKLGEDHPDMLTSMANLALTYSNQGRWDEAEQLDVQVMETSKTKLGEDHPDTLTSMGNLASTYWNQGRWDEAEQLFVQVMEMSKTKLGEDHPDTLASMANLAFSWKSSAHDVEAIVLLRECLIKQKQTLGQNHPTTLSNSRTLLECETEPLETEGEWETDEEWETDREFL